MKRLVTFVLFVLLLPICHANDMWFYDSSYIVLDTRLSANLHIISASNIPDIDFISANISFFPKERRNQDILITNFSPNAEVSGESALFEWRSPKNKNLSLLMFSRVRVDDLP
ncbi:MAG: hypothetical protein NT001_06430, partial [Candidatus Woesearchaeota archaeon]|nr:hypothetical protein [Candidatus Woesearchaeota archaeon]